MTTSPEFWSIALYVVATFILCGIMIGLSAMLGGKSGGRARNEPFESGVVSASPDRVILSWDESYRVNNQTFVAVDVLSHPH